MTHIHDEFLLQLTTWALITIRVAAFFFIAPFFGSVSIPINIKSFIAALTGYAIFQSGVVSVIAPIQDVWGLSFMLIKELSVGYVLSFFAHMIYMPFRLVGMQVGRVSGMGRAMVINPEEQDKFTVVQQTLYVIGVLIFLAMDGHLVILRILAATFEYIPLGMVQFKAKILDEMTLYFQKAYSQGIGYSAPVVGCVLINSLSFGLLSKTIPEMNLLILDLPMRSFVAFSMLIFALPMIANVYQKFILYTFKVMQHVIVLMS